MNQIDTTLPKRAIETAGENRVPVDDAINCNPIVQGAMDNFDNDENTQLVSFGSHDTIFILFQNLPKDSIDTSINDHDKVSIIQKKFKEVKNTDYRALDHNCSLSNTKAGPETRIKEVKLPMILKYLVNSMMNGKNLLGINF